VIHQFFQDLRYGIRRLVKRPGFTAIAILSIGIGIGANTAIFSLVNALMLRKLPLERSEELIDVYRVGDNLPYSPVSFPDLRDLEREMADGFAGVGAFRLAFVQEDRDGGVETLPAEIVTGNYFSLLGVPAIHGRTIQPADDVTPGGHPVVMLSHGYWQRRFGGDPGAVGQELRLNGLPFTIVGVVPAAYTGSLRGLSPAIYGSRMMVGQLNPSDSNELEGRNNQGVFIKARLAAGGSLPRAQGTLDRMAEWLQERYPDSWTKGSGLVAVPTADVIMHPMIDRVLVPAAGLMMAVVGLVLLIACANLASFLLAQAADRKKEVAVRLALGASRATLLRQLLTESVALAGAGGLVGVGLAHVGLGTLERSNLPLPIPIALDLDLDPLVLLFSLGLTIVAGLAFGLAPALQATKPDIAPTLKDETAGGGHPTGFNLRSALVVVQVAVSLLLLVGAALFLRSFRARLDIDPGFGHAPAAVVTFQEIPDRRSPEQIRNFFLSLREEVETLPGVERAGYVTDLHLSPLNNSMVGVTVPGVDPPPGREDHLITRAIVDGGFFDAVGIPILAGRGFSEADGPGSAPVVMASETFVNRFWPGQPVVGRSLRVDGADYAVIGVARDTKVNTLGEDPTPFLYFASGQNPRAGFTLTARTAADAERFVPEIVSLARRLDPEVVIIEAKTMARHLGAMLLPHQLAAWLISAFGGLALLLAAIGLFGVVNYAVSARSREVGIRMALGAQPGGIVRLLMGAGMRLVAIGAGLGLILSLLAARVMSGVLYGVKSMDLVAFLVAPVVLGLVAVMAAWVPARRATRVSPVRALKSD